jgi:cytochrome b561
VHWIIHSVAFAAALLGFLAAWKSHTLKQPPIPNFYSPHSYIGLTALLLLVGQVRVQQSFAAAAVRGHVKYVCSGT